MGPRECFPPDLLVGAGNLSPHSLSRSPLSFLVICRTENKTKSKGGIIINNDDNDNAVEFREDGTI